MIGAIAIALLAILSGTLATYAFDRGAPLYGRIAAGAYLGSTALAAVAFVLSLVIGLWPVTVILAGLVLLLPAALLRSTRIRAAVRADLDGVRERVMGVLGRRPRSATLVTAVYVAGIAAVAWLVADRTFFEGPDGLSIGNVNNLGDLPYHVQITASFAYAQNFPPGNPVFAGSGFSYHYLSDFLASVYVVAGATMVQAMFLMNLVLGLSLVALIHRWTRDITGSTVAARLAPLLVLLSGGLGWLFLLEEARVGEQGIAAAFFASDARYTIIPDGILRLGNAVTTLLIPQRGLLLGMGLAVIVFGLLRGRVTDAEDRLTPEVRGRMVAAGIITGFLPIVHVHTFAVVLGTAFLWGVAFTEWRNGRWRAWVAYLIAMGAAAVPILAWTARATQANASAFFGIQLGWEVGAENPLWFWLMNAGLFIPLWIAAFVWRRDGRPLLDRTTLLYALPFAIWFIVPNVFRLAPWSWDNIKVFVYWWLGAAPIVALVLARLWESRGSLRIAAVALAVILTTAGALDIARATVGRTYQEFDPDGIAFAERIRAELPPDAIVLTAPTWNTPIFLTGRQVFMGYAGFLWANGLPFVEREQHVRTMYEGGPGAAELLRENGIDYIVVGPHERREVGPNEEYLAGYPVVIQVGEYALHGVE